MMKRESGSGGGNSWTRLCDTCNAAACAVFCKADSAFLCAECDMQVHSANKVASRHERVWICESCGREPAAFLCKADAASLCVSCDDHVHSANPLARRHQRVPILPISGIKMERIASEEDENDKEEEEEDEEAASWLLPNPNQEKNCNSLLFGGEMEEYLDFVGYGDGGDQKNDCPDFLTRHQNADSIPRGGDSVVPVDGSFQLGLNSSPPKADYNYGISVPSMELGMMLEPSMTDISMNHSTPPNGNMDLYLGPPVSMSSSQLGAMDREARVLRYREKKKMRNFEKTIRYASRKAYAETRPRIKGRFAKRLDVDIEVDQMFSNSMISDTGYCIVPSF